MSAAVMSGRPGRRPGCRLVTVLPSREENGMKVYEAITTPSPAGIVTEAIEARFRPG
jgi:hypothetical protein